MNIPYVCNMMSIILVLVWIV
uniref:Uncharacterized protein n=1 Tax=Arundo donax TaxID=35708 RepID=A0A0A9FR92_ARUDO